MIQRENHENRIPEMIAIVGPTASGKTRHAVALAKEFDAEIISADSRQVYRGMTIGTGKDLEEYGSVPYHLIDICPAGDKYNLHRFLKDFKSAFKNIREKGRLPILCGGTGMYVEAAVAGLILPDVPENPELRRSLQDKSLSELTAILSQMKRLHNSTDVDSVKRAIRAIEIETWYRDHPEDAKNADRKLAKPIDTKIICIDIPRDVRRSKITQRLKDRLQQGMIEEVDALLKSGIPPDDLIYYGLEYKYVTLHLLGQLSYAEMFTQLETAIHQFAKRQMTWFRGMERRGFDITYWPYDKPITLLFK